MHFFLFKGDLEIYHRERLSVYKDGFGLITKILSDLLSAKSLRIVTTEKGKRKVHEVPQSQTAALPRHQDEEETDKSKQAQIEQMYGKN